MKFGTQNRDVNFQRELNERTLSTSALTIYSAIPSCSSPVTPSSAYHTRSRGVELTCSASPRPTSAHTPNEEHNLATTSRRPCSLSPPPSARPRTPTPRRILLRCRTERAANLMFSWLRSKGVPPKHVSLVRHARSAQAGSTNLSMSTTSPPIRLELSSPCRQI